MNKDIERIRAMYSAASEVIGRKTCPMTAEWMDSVVNEINLYEEVGRDYTFADFAISLSTFFATIESER